MVSGKAENLQFHVNDVPGISAILLFGFQQMMICLSMLLVIPYYVSNMICAGDMTMLIRVQMISATFVVSGIASILQSTFGMRLSILHGPSFAFLPALQTFENTFPCDKNTDITEWKHKLQLISGSCLLATSIIPILGLTGIIGKISRHIGPLTIIPLMSLLTINAVPNVEQKMSEHWISIVVFAFLIVFMVIFEKLEVPIPIFDIKNRQFYTSRHRILSQFPYLLAIGISWLICFILTITNTIPINSLARTDNNQSLTAFHNTPWIQIPVPGRYGEPKLNIALFCGFLSSCIAAMIESIGDYNVCARISEQNSPPASSVNRAFVVEGVGCMLAASTGIGTGITTYAENIAIMAVTKVTSRITLQTAGIFLIIAGIITKFAAFLAMIPDPIIGSVFAMGVCMINGVVLSNLQKIDIQKSRNLTIMGIGIIMGLTIPMYFQQNPIQTQNSTANDVLQTLLTTKMLVGGVLAFILDNITPGATRAERGLSDDESTKIIEIQQNGYIFPSNFNRFLLKFPGFCFLPIFPSKEEIINIEYRRNLEKEDNFKIKL